jgi:hypothetical protein
VAYPHRIRLRGPWECEPLVRIPADAPLPPKCRMTLPCRWGPGGLAAFAGQVRFRRRFGFPGRLDTFERVWLTFGGVESTAEVWLNGRVLGRHEGVEPFEFEVTSLLQVRNELRVEVQGPAERGGLWGEVALEVRCSAFLQSLRFRVEFEGETARLHVTGTVVGTAEQPLELYVLLDGHTVAYVTVEAGRPFEVISEELGLERLQERKTPHSVRVDLVNVATMWYQWEQPFPAGLIPE